MPNLPVDCPVLKGGALFREAVAVYINKSHELQEYCEKIHKHDFIEIAYIISGKGLHQVGDYRYEVTKGDLFIINYDVPHGFFSTKAFDEPLTMYNCVFRPEFLDDSLLSNTCFEDITSSFLFQSLFPEEYLPAPVLSLREVAFTEIGELFDKMYYEYSRMLKGYPDIIRAYLIELIIKIFRLLQSEGNRKITGRHRELMDRSIAYLKKNYHSEIRLEDLALKSFLSKNYFSKLFKEATGISFSDYIQRLRVDEACNLLSNSDLKVADIASEVGINDLTFFYEVFKRITGKTPGDYRKER